MFHKGRSISQINIADPVGELTGAKNSGNKSSLLDSLITEGKLSNSPLTGPQSILTETPITPSILVSNASLGIMTAEIKAAQSLPEGMKKSLMERVLESRPNTSVKEIRATCAILLIDSEPFIKSCIQAQTKDLSDQFAKATQKRQFDNISLSLFYKDKETVSGIASSFQETHKKSILQTAQQKKFTRTQQTTLELALLGQTGDPYLDLQRIQALLTLERQSRNRISGIFDKATDIHFQKFVNATKKAKDLVESDEDEFNQVLFDSLDAWKELQEAKGFEYDYANAFGPIIMTTLLIVSLVIINDYTNAFLYFSAAFAFGGVLYLVSENRAKQEYLKTKNKVFANYKNELEKDAELPSDSQ